MNQDRNRRIRLCQNHRGHPADSGRRQVHCHQSGFYRTQPERAGARVRRPGGDNIESDRRCPLFPRETKSSHDVPGTKTTGGPFGQLFYDRGPNGYRHRGRSGIGDDHLPGLVAFFILFDPPLKQSGVTIKPVGHQMRCRPIPPFTRIDLMQS